MDCNSKALSKTFFILLVLPTLLWGYGKAVIRLAQNGVSPTLGQFDDRLPENNSDTKPKSEKKGSRNQGTPVSTPVVERDSHLPTPVIEPDLPVESYKQMKAKKPSIPPRFNGVNAANFESGVDHAGGNVSLLKLLGIPTVIFGALFFVMWGIISGKIQRIMV